MSDDHSVVALFVDVRGFTRWSEANEVFVNLSEFIEGFLGLLRTRFKEPSWSLKPLGDGALMVTEVDEGMSDAETSRLLGTVLGNIGKVNVDFKNHCDRFGRKVGHAAHLDLGWGIVRGKVMRVGTDWAGHNLNKCSRLCNEARPFGILIDRDDFPRLPSVAKGFVAQIRRLAGIGEVSVWVTSEAASRFIPRERLREQPEVHVAGSCISDTGEGRVKVLIAKRSKERRLYPDVYEGCGGQLRYSESFDEGVRRHFRLELGIDVEVLTSLHTFYEIREPNEPLIPGIRFLCKQIGDSAPTSLNHSAVRWVSESEFRSMPATDFVGSLKREVLDLIDGYKTQRSTDRSKRQGTHRAP